MAARRISLRERLPRDSVWVLGLSMAGLMVYWTLTGQTPIGSDSHAYWLAWRRPMYTVGPSTTDAFLYSPLFAQVIWPLTKLPWPLFAGLVSLTNAALLAWLLKPLGWTWSVPLWLTGLPEVVSGNVDILLALAALEGLRRPITWAVPALTKVAPTLGPVWFLLRREWRQLALAVTGTLVIALPSVLLTPELWRQWLEFLWVHAHESGIALGLRLSPPLLVRLPFALALLVWGAPRERVWVLPVAMLLCTPVLWQGSFTVLAALPRMIPRETHSAIPSSWSQSDRARA